MTDDPDDNSDDPNDDRDASPSAGLNLEAVRARFREPRDLSLDDLAADAGLERDIVVDILTTSSRLTDDLQFGEADLHYLDLMAPLLQRFPDEQVLRSIRHRVRQISSLVIADLSSIDLDSTVSAAIKAGVDQDQLADLVGDMAEDMIPRMAELVAVDYRHQLLRLLDNDVVGRASQDLTADVALAVGFVDLVGFTRLSAEADPDGVGTILDAFEELVADTADQIGEVLPTKTLGDAVMVVSGDPDRLAQVLHRVVTTTDIDALAGVARRAGMAFGDVRVRDGDYVGTVVNTAARLTDLAHAGTLLITHEAWDALPDDPWSTSLLPPKHLKGLGKSRPLRLRDADEA